jgi:CIC family chloride channel protein
LKSHPYQRFPVVEGGAVTGILTRKEAESAVAEKRSPRLETAVTCLPGHTIRELQSLLIESTALMVVLLDEPKGKILGLVTLHDLLRAEVSVAKSIE